MYSPKVFSSFRELGGFPLPQLRYRALPTGGVAQDAAHSLGLIYRPKAYREVASADARSFVQAHGTPPMLKDRIQPGNEQVLGLSSGYTSQQSGDLRDGTDSGEQRKT